MGILRVQNGAFERSFNFSERGDNEDAWCVHIDAQKCNSVGCFMTVAGVALQHRGALLRSPAGARDSGKKAKDWDEWVLAQGLH
jgi:hypothetical protein